MSKLSVVISSLQSQKFQFSDLAVMVLKLSRYINKLSWFLKYIFTYVHNILSQDIISSYLQELPLTRFVSYLLFYVRK